MSKSLGTLTLDLVAKTGNFVGPMDKAGRKVKDFKKDAGGMKVSTVALTAALTGAAVATSAFVKQSINAAADARKTAQAVGITTESLTGLKWAANQATVGGAGVLEKGLVRLNASIGDAARGTKLQKETFENLGISIRNANGDLKSADDVLMELADKFADSADGAGKTDAAVKLLGRSGAELIPLLNSGSKGIKELTDQAKALGLVISDEQARQSEQFNDSLATLGATFRGVGNQIAGELLPTMNDLIGLLIDLGKEGDVARLVAEGIGNTLKLVATGAIMVVSNLQNLMALVETIKKSAVRDMGDIEFDELTGEFVVSLEKQEENKQNWHNFLEEIYKNNQEAVERINKLWTGAYAGVGQKATEVNKKIIESSGVQIDGGTGTKDNSDAINKQIEALELQAEAVGKTADEVTLSKLANEGATPAQLEAARAALEVVAAHEKQNAFLAEGANLTASMMTPLEQLAEKQRKYNELLESRAISQETFQRAMDEAQGDYDDFEIRVDADLEDFFAEIDCAKEKTSEFSECVKNAVSGWASDFSSTLTDMMWGAETSFGDIAESFGKMLTQMVMQQMVVQPLLNSFMGNFGGATAASAHGNVFDQGGLVPFAHGGVVNSPTIFPFANGTGLMGEAGPEAILPLSRLSNNDLGVKADISGISNTPQVNINIHEAAGTKATVEQSSDGQSLNVIIERVENAISGRMAKGTGLAGFFDGRYGRRY